MRAGTRVKVEQVSKRAMRGPTHLRNGEGCPCCGSEILGCVHPPGLPLSPESHLWSPVFRCRLLSRLGSLPAGITVEGATPPRGGVSGGPKGGPLTPPRWRTSAEKGGVAPSTSSPSRAAPRRAVRGGDARGRRRTTLYPRGFGESVPTRFQCGFPGTAWTTTARASPSDSADL